MIADALEVLERLPLEQPDALRVFALAVVMVAFVTALVLLADRTPPPPPPPVEHVVDLGDQGGIILTDRPLTEAEVATLRRHYAAAPVLWTPSSDEDLTR